ncbi:MAG: hypothetical protein GWP74_15305, partial [Proteobacteria bacterium]|nr:hypothetical protein [Pseudomonadota bacterium]
TALAKEFGKHADKFCAIARQEQWKPSRGSQTEHGVVYSDEALKGLKLKKKKKKKKS